LGKQLGVFGRPRRPAQLLNAKPLYGLSMDRAEIRKVVREYLDLIEAGAESVSENERQLGILLDRLPVAMHSVTFEFDDANYPEAPRRDQAALRSTISTRFPRYGYYNVPETVTQKIGEASCIVGDAIDDILDIANDLSQVEWCWRNTSEDDALWHLRQSFETHWREHLRGLQLYLNCLESGQ
jgi:hypothetical protein